MFAEQKEFVGSGAKQKAAAYAADRAKAGSLSTEFPIEVYRAQFDRNGCLKGQSVVERYQIGE